MAGDEDLGEEKDVAQRRRGWLAAMEKEDVDSSWVGMVKDLADGIAFWL